MPKSDEGELSELTAEQSDEAEHLPMGSHRLANVQLWLHNRIRYVLHTSRHYLGIYVSVLGCGLVFASLPTAILLGSWKSPFLMPSLILLTMQTNYAIALGRTARSSRQRK